MKIFRSKMSDDRSQKLDERRKTQDTKKEKMSERVCVIKLESNVYIQ
jgi:hypothetical protein